MTSLNRRSGFKLVTKDYGPLCVPEDDQPYLPGKTRRLTAEEVSRFKIRSGPALHFCESPIDCLGYVAQCRLSVGQSILDGDTVDLRLLRVSVPDDGSPIQRVGGSCARKCAATVLHSDAEVTDRDELAALFHGAHFVRAVDANNCLIEWHFVDGRYVSFVKTDAVGNIILYCTTTTAGTVRGTYAIVDKPDDDLTFSDVVHALDVVMDNGKIQYCQDGIVVKTYTAGELRDLYWVGMIKIGAMGKEQQTVVYE